MCMAVARIAPRIPLIDLLHDAPPFDLHASAHLLAALAGDLRGGDVVVAVVDPGVGSEARLPVAVHADNVWFVGPGNGLFDVVASRAHHADCFQIVWRPERLSASFHGRDLFAPVGACLAVGEPVAMINQPVPANTVDVRGRGKVIYIDRYGNVMTDLRASELSVDARLKIEHRLLPRAVTFANVSVGAPFWYENSSGLVEVAVNQGSAAQMFALEVGDHVSVH
ncbi:MAG: hypothetical protein GKR94_08795 [Gammaproteobacteria bacterium]|nr:hypothetical protein [Gammaproteobacteria bacterium]